MADLQKTIEIIFGATDDTGNALRSMSSNIEGAVNDVSKLTEPLSSLADKALKTEAAIIALGAAMLAYSVNQAGKFNSAINEIATLTDLTGSAIGGYGESILQYAQNSTMSLEQITQATYSAISAGVDYKDALAVVAQAEQLAVAGKGDLNASLVVLISSLNAYGLGADSAQRFSDALFSTVRLGQTTLPELAASLAQVTGIAGSAGVDFEQLLAAISALTASGNPTSQSITQIKAALSNIIKPSSDARDLAKELGIEFNATALQSKGFSGVLDDVKDATGGNVTQMARLFGSVEGLNGVLTLTGKGAENFAKSLEQIYSGAGATDEAFKKMAQNLELVTQNMINNFDAMTIKIGQPLIDQWTSIVDALSAVFKGVATGIDQGALDVAFEALNAFGVNVEAFLRQLATNLPDAMNRLDFTGLIAEFGKLGVSVGGIFDRFDFSTSEGVAASLQFVIDSVETLTRVVSGIVDVWAPVISKMIDYIDAANKSDDQTKDLVATLLGGSQVFEQLKGAVLSGADALDVIGTALSIIAGTKAIESMTSLKGALTGLGLEGAAAQFTALTFAAGSLYFAYERLVPAIDEYNKRQKNYEEASEGAAWSTEKLALKLAEIRTVTGEGIRSLDDFEKFLGKLNESTGLNIKGFIELKEAIVSGIIVWDKAEGTWVRSAKALDDAGQSANDMGTQVDKAGEKLEKSNAAIEKTADSVEDLGKASKEYGGEQEKLNVLIDDAKNKGQAYVAGLKDGEAQVKTLGKAHADAADGMKTLDAASKQYGSEQEKLNALIAEAQRKNLPYVAGMKDGAAQITLLGKAHDEASESLKKSAEETGKLSESQKIAIQNAHDMEKTLLQIASNERIKSLEFKVKLDIEQVKAAAQAFGSVMETIGKFWDSSGNVLEALTKGFEVSLNSKDRKFFLDMIQSEMDLRWEHMQIERESANALNNLLYAQAEALLQETVVRIESDGLDASIEAFMFEVLKRIQTKIVGDKSAFLLGAGLA